jgi:integrase
LLPEDLDLESGVLRVSNKPRLYWQVKTRNEREIPLVPVLADVLRLVIGTRSTGPMFLRRRFVSGERPLHAGKSQLQLENELLHSTTTAAERDLFCRAAEARFARRVWRDAGMIKTERIRMEFMRLTRSIGVPEITAPKSLRHGFATSLQDANVDPIVRCELMGHSTGARGSGHGLGMTATYTHTRPETMRAELIRALSNRRSYGAAERWLRAQLRR